MNKPMTNHKSMGRKRNTAPTPSRKPPPPRTVTVGAFLKAASFLAAKDGRARAALTFVDSHDRHEWFVHVPTDLAKPFVQALEASEASDGVGVLVRFELVK